MNQVTHFDLEQTRQRLEYYTGLKERSQTAAADKWVKIYTERLAKLERQIAKMGLRTEIETSAQTVTKATAKKSKRA